MEGNEIEKAAINYIVWRYGDYYGNQTLDRIIKESFDAGAKWKSEREKAELTRANARIEELTSQNLELVRKYDDLYRKANGQ